MIGPSFWQEVERLRLPGMGTEHVALLLYSLVRMLRPRRLLEVGPGYTTPFLLQALDDNFTEVSHDQELIQQGVEGDQRTSLVIPEQIIDSYQPRLLAIDDFSVKPSSAETVRPVAAALGLDKYLQFRVGDFRVVADEPPDWLLPIDFAWIDAGVPSDDADFLARFWSLINPARGIVILHDAYWTIPVMLRSQNGGSRRAVRTVPTAIANEIRRQLLQADEDPQFEVMGLLEPHKYRQNGVLLVRKLPAIDRVRKLDFGEEFLSVTGSSHVGFSLRF